MGYYVMRTCSPLLHELPRRPPGSLRGSCLRRAFTVLDIGWPGPVTTTIDFSYSSQAGATGRYEKDGRNHCTSFKGAA